MVNNWLILLIVVVVLLLVGALVWWLVTTYMQPSCSFAVQRSVTPAAVNFSWGIAPGPSPGPVFAPAAPTLFSKVFTDLTINSVLRSTSDPALTFSVPSASLVLGHRYRLDVKNLASGCVGSNEFVAGAAA
jgi:hypothetical protein